MPTLQRVVKPKTRRGKRELLKRQPQLVETEKTAIFLRGAKSSETSLKCIKDLSALKKPHSVFFNRKHNFLPFEDTSSLEFFSKKNDASLFAFASHNKKRPNNVILGRMYDYQLLDMIELGIDNYKSLQDFKGIKIAVGTKPCLIFTGELFEKQPEYQRLKNYFIDFFRGPEVVAIRLAGLEHVLLFTATDGKIYLRSYRILMKKSGMKTPRIELEEIGPAADFTLRRTKLASADLFKLALKQPTQIKPKKVKNIKKDAFGSKLGRIHLQRQDLGKLQTRKMKGLKKIPKKRKQKTNNTANAKKQRTQ